jgi:hypothetical protein
VAGRGTGARMTMVRRAEVATRHMDALADTVRRAQSVVPVLDNQTSALNRLSGTGKSAVLNELRVCGGCGWARWSQAFTTGIPRSWRTWPPPS